MRLLYYVFVFLLIAAVVAPFYLKGPNGMPLMTVDKFIDDSTPEMLKTPTEVYRWKDQHGVWQYGDEPPLQDAAERLEIKPNMTPIKADWVAQLEARQQADGGGGVDRITFTRSMPELGDVYGGEAMQTAEDAAKVMEGYMEKVAGALEEARK